MRESKGVCGCWRERVCEERESVGESRVGERVCVRVWERVCGRESVWERESVGERVWEGECVERERVCVSRESVWERVW